MAVAPYSVWDGGMSLQWNAEEHARGVTLDGQSGETEGQGEDRGRGKMIGLCVHLQYTYTVVHSSHSMKFIKLST